MLTPFVDASALFRTFVSSNILRSDVCVFQQFLLCDLTVTCFWQLGISVCRLSICEYKQYFANDSDAQRHLPILCCMQLLVLVGTSHALLNEAFMMSASRSFSWGSNFTSCLLSFVDKSYCMLMCVCIVTSASRMFVQSLRYLFFQAVALPARRNKQSCAF